MEHLCLVIGKVLGTQETIVPSHLFVDGGGDLAFVQGVFALSADPFEGVGEVALNDFGAGRRGISVRQEYSRRLAIPD